MVKKNLTIIIPTFNEMKVGIFPLVLDSLKKIKNTDIIFIDSYSSDGTRELINKYNYKIIDLKTDSRASRLNLGVEKANTDFVLLHHPRSVLSSQAVSYLNKADFKFTWAAFKHSFDDNNLLLRFTSWYSNFIRGKLKGIFYLDHCLLIDRQTFLSKGGIPEIDIFEDTELSKILRDVSRPVLLPYFIRTSAFRFKTNGVFKQSILNQILKITYFFKISDKLMNKKYEYNLNLNSDYCKKNKIVAFVKTPDHSPIKTRLQNEIGEESLALYSLFCKCLRSLFTKLDENKKTSCYYAISEKTCLDHKLWDQENVNTIWQSDGDLGDKLFHVFKILYEPHSVIVFIGADSPQLTDEIIYDAINKVTADNVVFGKASDGGFYLLATSSNISEKIWKSVGYSSSTTLDEFKLALEQENIKTLILPKELSDCDYKKDLLHVYNQLLELDKKDKNQIDLIGHIEKNSKLK